MSISKIDSQIIRMLRFPLAVCVIFCHLNPEVTRLADLNDNILSTQGIISFIETGLSYVLGHIAVFCFFLFSGILFFKDLESWDWNSYYKKIRTRITSLLIPYICWNLISILSFAIFSLIHDGTSIIYIINNVRAIGIEGFWDYNVWGINRYNWLGQQTLASGPFVVPLWFLRDLMVVCMLAPCFHFLITKARYWGGYLLLACFISRIWFPIKGLSIDACFFFYLGGYISVYGNYFRVLFSRFRHLGFLLAGASFLLCTYYGGIRTTTGFLLLPICALLNAFTIMHLAEWVENTHHPRVLPILEKSAFFIFVLHACPFPHINSLLGLCYTYLYRGWSIFQLPEIITYITTPFVTSIICLAIYYSLEKWAPVFCRILTGNR